MPTVPSPDGLRGRHVAIATRIYPPEVGAAAFRQRHLTHALADAGARVTVLTVRPGMTGNEAGQPNVEVSRWPVLRDDAGAVRGYAQYASFDVPLAGRLLALPRPDVMVAEPPPTTGAVVAAVAARRRVPFAYYAADVWSDGASATSAPALLVDGLRRLEVRTLSKAKVVLSTSDAISARLRALGVSAGTIVTVGNGVDTSIFRPEGDHPPIREPYFVYAGTISEWQGVEVFIRALAVLRRTQTVRLVVLGQGVDRASLQHLAAQVAPDAVHFLDPQPPEVAATWLRGCVAALASLRPDVKNQTMTPTKIFAAAACGVPVLFAGSGAGADLVRDNDLGIATAHDTSAVARAMERLLVDRPDRARLARWAAQHGSLESTARHAAAALGRCVTLAP